MRRQVFALALPTVKKYWFLMLFVGTTGVIFGSIATMKSFLESTIINLVSSVLAEPSADLWSIPMDVENVVDDSWVGDLLSALPLDGLAQVLAAYGIVTLLGAVLTIGTAAARERITQHAFVSIVDRAADAAASNDLDEQKWDDQPGGLAGAIQPSAHSLAGSSALIVEGLQYLFALATVASALVFVGPGFGAAFLLLLAVFVGLTVLQGSRLAGRRKSFDEQRVRLFGRTAEVLDNKEVLLAHERKGVLLESLHDHAQRLGRLDRQLTTSQSAYRAVTVAITDGGRIGILALVAYFAVQGADVQSAGDAYFYVSLFARVVSPISGILRGFDDLYRSTAMSTTILDIVDRQHKAGGAEGKRPAPPADTTTPAIEFKDVSLAYEDHPVLSHVSFSMPRNGLTLVVGPSGVGKTTIARLILGFQTPQGGQVKLYGIDVREWDWAHLLLQCSYGAQTRHVLNDKVRENLFPAVGVKDSEMLAVLADVGLGGVGLDHAATDLSEGQRQRLALARILLDKAPIVVLDEPLSGVDILTFVDVHDRLRTWLTDTSAPRTVVLISHRLAFASLAQHVVVLGEGGHVIAEGHPDEMRSKQPDGPFARMWAASSAVELGGSAARP